MKNDINLVHELDELLFTDNDTDAIAKPFLWKRFRRVESGAKEFCPSCNPINSGIIEGQLGCIYCEGLGYLWDEVLIQGYTYQQNSGRDKYNLGMKANVGRADNTQLMLVTPGTWKPEKEDFITDLMVNEYGQIQVPIELGDTYKVIQNRVLRASKNKVDFYLTHLGG